MFSAGISTGPHECVFSRQCHASSQCAQGSSWHLSAATDRPQHMNVAQEGIHLPKTNNREFGCGAIYRSQGREAGRRIERSLCLHSSFCQKVILARRWLTHCLHIHATFLRIYGRCQPPAVEPYKV